MAAPNHHARAILDRILRQRTVAEAFADFKPR